jgi:hypothetical protein
MVVTSFGQRWTLMPDKIQINYQDRVVRDTSRICFFFFQAFDILTAAPILSLCFLAHVGLLLNVNNVLALHALFAFADLDVLSTGRTTPGVLPPRFSL